jgi:hypothetical protein
MVCNCMKKPGVTPSASPLLDAQNLLDASTWGPITWRYLHILAERAGTSGNKVIDTDQSVLLSGMINLLPSVVPCQGCQQHAQDYIASHPLPMLQGLYGSDLTVAVRTWLFDFHSVVRARLGQPVLVGDVTACAEMYRGAILKQCEYTTLVQSVAAGIRSGIVKLGDWKRFYNFSERLRMISGNPMM